ncbi:Rrf2 family transcriptional regulator [Pseudooceanicola sp. 216_PA32_1]|uniref:Rrf2 family transcriptional regulator n=1 Tax=Pseudooceanicola pacificus TaxID=2676438 RepID=A0A844W7X1_9RHOB|nr:Rrf2 family transcriptional regulator [Pseudooceanicola pacificus]MWB79235.1 Rrf2 family transcriptional regulator [Pseudooceanicola pacificus]
MRLTKRTNISMRVLMYCAANMGRLVTKSEIAERCNTSENHLAQVINRLGQLGFVQTQRGRNGGLTLGRDSRDIRVGDVFRAIETGVPVTECFADDENTCPLIDACLLRPAIADAIEAFYRRMDEVSLDQLVCGNHRLIEMLTPEACRA